MKEKEEAEEEELEEDEYTEAEMEAKTPEVKKSKKKSKKKPKNKDLDNFQKATTQDMIDAGLPVKFQVFIESKYGKGDFYLSTEDNTGLYHGNKGDIVDFRLPNREIPKEVEKNQEIPKESKEDTKDMNNPNGKLLKSVKGLDS